MTDDDAQTFSAVEKDLYIEPPQLPLDATENEIRKAWAEWQVKEAQARKAHRIKFNRGQKASSLELKPHTVKMGGVNKQTTTYLSDLEQIQTTAPNQDYYFKARGGRAGNRKQHRKDRRKAKQLVKNKGLHK